MDERLCCFSTANGTNVAKRQLTMGVNDDGIVLMMLLSSSLERGERRFK